jgi:hypothetical protein
MTRPQRSGASLLLALVAVTAIAGTALQARVSARVHVAGFRNRAAEARAGFRNTGCLVRRMAELDAALQAAASVHRADSSWTHLDDIPSALGDDCQLCVSPAGRTVDVNTADTVLLAAAASRLDPARMREIVDRILDWRDGDDLRREFGAEQSDYADTIENSPANRAFVSNAEVVAAVGRSLGNHVLELLSVQNAPLWTNRRNARLMELQTAGITDTASAPTAWFIGAYTPVSPTGAVSGTRWRLVRAGSALAAVEQDNSPIGSTPPTPSTDCQ